MSPVPRWGSAAPVASPAEALHLPQCEDLRPRAPPAAAGRTGRRSLTTGKAPAVEWVFSGTFILSFVGTCTWGVPSESSGWIIYIYVVLG